MAGKRLVIRVFSTDTLGLDDGVSLTILRPEKTIEANTRDFYEVVTELKERYRSTPNKVILVVEYGRNGQEPERKATISTVEDNQAILLFPEPVRLRAVYIVKGVKPGSKESLSSFKRIEIREEIYVYQGRIGLNDAELVILDTEKGIKVVTRGVLRG